MKLRENLIAAKALIDTPEKWTKGTYGSRSKRLCALGACRVVMYGTTKNMPVEDGWSGDGNPLSVALGRALWPNAGLFGTSDFNDDPSTTHADVMALFDRAIEAAE